MSRKVKRLPLRRDPSIEISGSGSNRIWDKLPWKSVNLEGTDLGQFEDSVFFGLEEIDGNAYRKLIKSDNKSQLGLDDDIKVECNDEVGASNPISSKEMKCPKRKSVEIEQDLDSERKEVKNKKIKKSDKTVLKKIILDDETQSVSISSINDEEWGGSGVYLHSLIRNSLIELNFTAPTPIQEKAIPYSTKRDHYNDIVGAAETGSGKTLAFGLPILHSLLHKWESYRQDKSPHSLIIAPTRELALQITKVLKDICSTITKLNTSVKIEIVTIVGGLAEQKQYRQLNGTKPPHIVVATPGRLCIMIV